MCKPGSDRQEFRLKKKKSHPHRKAWVYPGCVTQIPVIIFFSLSFSQKDISFLPWPLSGTFPWESLGTIKQPRAEMETIRAGTTHSHSCPLWESSKKEGGNFFFLLFPACRYTLTRSVSAKIFLISPLKMEEKKCFGNQIRPVGCFQTQSGGREERRAEEVFRCWRCCFEGRRRFCLDSLLRRRQTKFRISEHLLGRTFQG